MARFAAALRRGLETDVGARYGSLDELASDLHGCLVQVKLCYL